jgi:hypothetical protein
VHKDRHEIQWVDALAAKNIQRMTCAASHAEDINPFDGDSDNEELFGTIEVVQCSASRIR